MRRTRQTRQKYAESSSSEEEVPKKRLSTGKPNDGAHAEGINTNIPTSINSNIGLQDEIVKKKPSPSKLFCSSDEEESKKKLLPIITNTDSSESITEKQSTSKFDSDEEIKEEPSIIKSNDTSEDEITKKKQPTRKLIDSSDDEKPDRKPKSDDSSSDSDIDNYLTHPDKLNLKSKFFKSPQATEFSKIEQNIFNNVNRLSDSESEDDEPLAKLNKSSEKNEASVSKDIVPLSFQQLDEYTKKIEEAKKFIELYQAKKAKEEKADDISKLLTQGEKNISDIDINEAIADGTFHSSDFESCSEKEDWEEVKQAAKPTEPTKDGVEITLELPQMMKKKKGIDLVAVMKRRLNRIKKENQVYVHKVHLLCWIAHGNYVNSVLNKEDLLAMALSLLPSQQSYPTSRPDLKYLEQIVTWYRKTIENVEKVTRKDIPLEKSLIQQITKKQADNKKMLVYIFICILRSLGIQCRLVISLQVEPLKPPVSELHSLSAKEANKPSTSKGSRENKASPSKENKLANKELPTKGSGKLTKSSKSTTKSMYFENKDDMSSKEEKSSKKEKLSSKTTIKMAIEKNLKKTPNEAEPAQHEKNYGELLPMKAGSKRTLRKTPNKVEINKSEGIKKSESTKKSPAVRKTKESLGIKSDQIKPDHHLNDNAKIESTKLEKVVNERRSRKPPQSTEKIEQDDKKEAKVAPKRARTTRTKNTVAKVEKNIDDIVASLENMESGESSKPITSSVVNKKPVPTLTVNTITSEADLNLSVTDRDTWRRSKSLSPGVAKQTDELTSKSIPKRSRSQRTNLSPSPCVDEKALNQTDDIEAEPIKKRRSQRPNLFKLKTLLPSKIKKTDSTNGGVPQLDGVNYESDSSGSDSFSGYSFIPQLDGPTNDEPQPSTSKKPALKKLKQHAASSKPHPIALKIDPIYKNTDSEDEFRPRSPFTSKNCIFPASKNSPNLHKLREKLPPKTSPNEKSLNVKNDIIKLIKGSMSEHKRATRRKKAGTTNYDEESDSDYAPEPEKKIKKESSSFIKKVHVKRRVLPRSQIDLKVFSDDEKGKSKGTKSKEPQVNKGCDIWVEVFLEAEEKWICADIVTGQVHCIKEVASRATHPISYIVAWDNNNKVKDISKRYCPNWNTVTRKLRVESKWWDQSLKPYIGTKTARDREEDEDLARQQLDQPLPKTIGEYKDHPLYVLKRHLLKFQAIYPREAITLGFVRNEAVYPRECVYTLHSREIWVKHAKVVKPGEEPYKIVKARPKYDKLSNTCITDQPLEIFGEWQVGDYIPPTAENGLVPRNAFGNVELFKPCMLPRKTVHLRLPGLNKLARRMNIDCAQAVVGFDYNSGGSYPTFDGFVVCEERQDELIAAWYIEQEEAEKREQEKYEKRVYGNWRRLTKALLIRERLKARYDFGGTSSSNVGAGKEKKKPKGPRFLAKKRRTCSDSESDNR